MSSNQIQTVCLIGGGGFIGSHLIDRLLEENNYKLFCLDISSSKLNHCIDHKNLTYIKADISDIEDINSFIERSDCVISLVAICNPVHYNTIPLKVINVGFLQHLELVQTCTKMKKWFIHFSTSEIYGKTLSYYLRSQADKNNSEYFLLKEDSTPLILGSIQAQRWSYASAKQLLERIIYAYHFEQGLEYTIIRPFNFIGPRMDYLPSIDGGGLPRVMACFMDALLFDKALKLVDGGKNKRCFTYIKDAVDAIALILQNPDKSKNEIFNIGNPNNEISIEDLAQKMKQIYKEFGAMIGNAASRIESVSAEDFYGKGYEDSDRRVPDITKAQKLLNWEPKTDIETTLQKTIRYYVSKYKNDNKSNESS